MPSMGFKHSLETIAKMREAHRGHRRLTVDGRQRLADAAQRHPHGANNLRRINQARLIVLTDEMTIELLRMYRRGWHYETIAELIGMSREVLRREVRRLELPDRRRNSRAFLLIKPRLFDMWRKAQ